MIEVSSGARKYLQERLPQASRGVCFRVMPGLGSDVAMRLAVPEKDDVTVTHEGDVILSVEPSVARRLEGWVLDVGIREGKKDLVLTPKPS